MIETHEPQTALGQALRAQMSDLRWQREIKAALVRAAVIEAVKEERKTSNLSWRRALATAAPDVLWPTYRSWRRKHDRLNGPAWERLLDERSPPNRALTESIVASARTLREVDRTMTTAKARECLGKQYGEDGEQRHT